MAWLADCRFKLIQARACPVPLRPSSIEGPGYAEAREPVMAWNRLVRDADWATPADVKRAIRSSSILKDGRAVFNIAGNKYRIVVWINYAYRVVYIRFIGTHRQYDAIDAETV